MRYTTIIDLREQRTLYRSSAIRLVYLHLVLISGYHDEDRDLADISIRNLARETGLSISATRCALTRLQDAQLVTRQGTLWAVKKFIIETPITPRAKTVKQAKKAEIAAIDAQAHDERERARAREAQERAKFAAMGKTPWMAYFDDLRFKAAQGDQDAKAFVTNPRNLQTYAVHAAQIREDLNKQKKQ